METDPNTQPPTPSARVVQPFAFIGNGPANDAQSFTEYVEEQKMREANFMRADRTDHPSMYQADDIPDERSD